MYKDDGKRYVYDGDFEQYLLNIGVDSRHIERMKEKKLQGNRDIYYNIDGYDSREELVPLEKVIGTSRGTIGDSVFENVRMMKYGDREPTRFYSCFSFLDRMSLEELKESYKKLYDPVQMIYYEEDDEYYLSNGNHRTLTAMLIGARYIKAKVYSMHCDFDKKMKYIATKEFFDKYNIYKIIKGYFGTYDIIFIENEKCYEVRGFGGKESKGDCYDIIRMLSYEIENDKNELKFWIKIPEKLRRLLEICYGKRRVFQYINKCDYKFNVYETVIYLYDF